MTSRADIDLALLSIESYNNGNHPRLPAITGLAIGDYHLVKTKNFTDGFSASAYRVGDIIQ